MVVIKSYPGGISLHVDSDVPFNALLEEIAGKFEESRKFFRNASVAISVEGRTLSLEEEKELIQCIDTHSDLQIMCIVGKNEETNRKFIKALKRVELQREENNGRFYKGNVLPDQIVESEGNLVIIGSVMEGATVVATKNIIVLGELAGEAFAGINNDEDCFICAMKLTANRCKISGKEYRAGKSGIFDKKKSQPAIVYSKDGSLVCDVITPEIVANAASI